MQHYGLDPTPSTAVGKFEISGPTGPLLDERLEDVLARLRQAQRNHTTLTEALHKRANELATQGRIQASDLKGLIAAVSDHIGNELRLTLATVEDVGNATHKQLTMRDECQERYEAALREQVCELRVAIAELRANVENESRLAVAARQGLATRIEDRHHNLVLNLWPLFWASFKRSLGAVFKRGD